MSNMPSPELSSLLKTVGALPGISIRRKTNLMPIIVSTTSLSKSIPTIELDDDDGDDDDDDDDDVQILDSSLSADERSEKENQIVLRADPVAKLENDILSENGQFECSIPPVRSRDLFAKFINLCLGLDSSEAMRKISQRKLIRYYLSARSQYTGSDEFCTLVDQKMRDIKNKPGHLFVYIRDIVNELNARRPKTIKNDLNIDPSAFDKNVKDSKKNNDIEQKIAQIERTMKILSETIRNFEEQEIDDNNENDYILEHKYKARMARLHKKLCILKGERGINSNKNTLQVLSNITLEDDRLPNLKMEIKSLVLSKKCWFPDYHDILECVKRCALKSNFDLSNNELQSRARDIFVEFGIELQKRRKVAEYQSLCDLINSCTSPIGDDPAESDPHLEAALRKNHELGKRKEREVFEKFAKKHCTYQFEENAEHKISEDLQKTKVELNESDKKTKKIDDCPIVEIEETYEDMKKESLDILTLGSSKNSTIIENEGFYDSDIEIIL